MVEGTPVLFDLVMVTTAPELFNLVMVTMAPDKGCLGTNRLYSL